MSLTGTWETKEDFERDLLLFAEFSVSAELEDDQNRVDVPESPFDVLETTKNNDRKGFEEPEVPETIRDYEKRMEENQKSLIAGSSFDENLSYYVSGRGRGIKDRIIRPGQPVETDPSDDIELKKMIRQVSGLGYSNQLIENHIKAKYEEQEAEAAGTSSDCMWEVCPPKTSLKTSAPSTSAELKKDDVQKININEGLKNKKDDLPKKQSSGFKGKKSTSSYASSVKSVKDSPQWFDCYAKPKGYNLDSDFPPLK